ncbi:MAG: M48 family metalloprotease [Pseudomonadota bacterium]
MNAGRDTQGSTMPNRSLRSAPRRGLGARRGGGTRALAQGLAKGLVVACVSMAMLAPDLARAFSLIRDAEIERTVSMLTRPILRAASVPNSSVQVYLINDSGLNAFVAGGRNMFLHTGLLSTLDKPEELQGVIAHEIGHITGGHLARRQIALDEARGPALLGMLLGVAAAAAGAGGAGLAAGLGLSSATTRSFLRFNRAEEAAADQAALVYMERAGINPVGLQNVLARFRGQEVLTFGSLDPYTQTHPLTTDRMQLIDDAARRAAEREWPRDPEVDYWHARMRAKIQGFLSNPRRVLNTTGRLPGDGLPQADEIALYREAIALHRLPDPDAALRAVDRLVATRPRDAFYHELRGQILFETGRAEDAVPSYRRAVELAPDAPLLKTGLGRVLLALETPAADAEALSVLEAARREDTADAAGMRDLAVAYDRAGRRDLATLVTAERLALIGRRSEAIRFAGQASRLLQEGSPGWLRAQDILAMNP